MTPLEPGYYWLRDHWDARWIVARYSGGVENCWTFTGSMHLCDMDEVLGPPSDDDRTYELGPRVEEPAQ